MLLLIQQKSKEVPNSIYAERLREKAEYYEKVTDVIN